MITLRIDFADLWIMDNSHAVSNIVPSDGDSDGDSTAMELDSPVTSDDDEVPLNNNRKISKPSGAPGRPNSGGYNVEHELRAWGTDKISQVTVGLDSSPSICETNL